jgi:hypothetical protein
MMITSRKHVVKMQIIVGYTSKSGLLSIRNIEEDSLNTTVLPKDRRAVNNPARRMNSIGNSYRFFGSSLTLGLRLPAYPTLGPE